MNIDPDEIFLDAYNLPAFDRQQFEGELEHPIKKPVLFFLTGAFCLVGLLFLGRIFDLQINRGLALAARSENNTLRHTPVFAERGLIYDRLGRELAWNNSGRVYATGGGLSHLLGYVGYPTGDDFESKQYHPQELIGRAGVEKIYSENLHGETGVRIEEVDAYGVILSDYLLNQSRAGDSVYLAVDSRVQSKLFGLIKDLAETRGFAAGAGVIINVQTGELLSLVSYPEYDSTVLSLGDDREKINQWLNDDSKPFLNRAVSGLYTPGSIIKPIIAVGALNEELIDPEKKIVSTGALTLSNPYDPERPTIFGDWKAHGATNLRQALAVSSNVYFYTIGGGFEQQAGLGINLIERYARLFGLGEPTGINWVSEASGIVPTPEWKARVFPGDPWRIGDTYHATIGQYGFQVTPLQIARAVAAIANNGWLVTPTVLFLDKTKNTPSVGPKSLADFVKPEALAIVREGMRLAVTTGTAAGLDIPTVAVAAKTGTAELGIAKENVNSWVVGFFPYENPRYAFAVVMEKGRRGNTIGGVFVMRQLFDWLGITAPEYLQSEKR